MADVSRTAWRVNLLTSHLAVNDVVANKNYTIGIDLGTSSTRAIVFDCATFLPLASHQIELRTFYPHEGWVEQDPIEIFDTVYKCLNTVVQDKAVNMKWLKGIGITNQRETTILWDKNTGKPLYNAIVWRDARTADMVTKLAQPPNSVDCLRSKCGLPLSPYFSALKLKWMLDNVPGIYDACVKGSCLFGTVDTWLIWNLTGGTKGGVHVTDVTNASRTMLMDLKTLQWDEDLCHFFKIPKAILPQIRSCSELFGKVASGKCVGIPVCGCIGDQQSALLGQACVQPGSSKNTYGTGCFMLRNTGETIVHSKHGLLTTVAYKLGPNVPAIYALEGSVAVAGRAVQWLRDNMKMISKAVEINKLALTVPDSGGLIFVPAFSGLLAPRWNSSARGIAIGINEATSRGHWARAILESICYQSREILDSMTKDCGVQPTLLLVDGGMAASDLVLQFQADILGIPVGTICYCWVAIKRVARPPVLETTALGAAIAAGLAVNACDMKDLQKKNDTVSLEHSQGAVFYPKITEEMRQSKFNTWNRAVERCLNWTV